MTKKKTTAFNPVDIYVGRRVRFKRKMVEWTQSDLARRIGLTFQQVQKYEKGENRISASKLWKIANALDTQVSFFFKGLKEGENNIDIDNGNVDHFLINVITDFKAIKNPDVKKRIAMLIKSCKND